MIQELTITLKIVSTCCRALAFFIHVPRLYCSQERNALFRLSLLSQLVTLIVVDSTVLLINQQKKINKLQETKVCFRGSLYTTLKTLSNRVIYHQIRIS